MLDVMIDNINIQSLHLSENNLSDSIMPSLCKIINSHPALKEVYLRWNKITPEGGKTLFEELAANQSLRVLDLSWNLLGLGNRINNKEKNMVESLNNFLENNQDLYHLDLSCNKFTFEESKAIANCLKKNKTIYGFHFEGNFGNIDSMGFLKIDEKGEEFDYIGNLLAKKINGVKPHRATDRKVKYVAEESIYDCCWICDNWAEVFFKYGSKSARSNI